MPKTKPGALDALRKLQQQRNELDVRETELRQRAAAELGQIVLDCGAEQFDPGVLKALLKAVIKIGPAVALDRLADTK